MTTRPDSTTASALTELLTTERRRVPRVPFRATSVVAETGSSQVVVAQTSEISQLGCFVQTVTPYPPGTRVHIELAEGGSIFTASGLVAFVTSRGMGVVFSGVESPSREVLSRWLSPAEGPSDGRGFTAIAEVRDLGSRQEQVLSTRDLSTNGCFIETPTAFPSGTLIRVRLEHGGSKVTAIGRVTDNVWPQGMGIEFVEVDPRDRAVLAKWVAEGTKNR